MRDFNFTVHVRGLDLDDDDQVDRLYDAPFSITAHSSDADVMLSATVEAESDVQAWQIFNRFMCDHNPDVHLARLDLDLVTISEIAERCDASRETVRLWTTGARRADFPPSLAVAGNVKLWAWADVFEWLETKGVPALGVYDEAPLSFSLVETCNGTLARRRGNGKGNLSTDWLTIPRAEQKVISFTPQAAKQNWSVTRHTNTQAPRAKAHA